MAANVMPTDRTSATEHTIAMRRLSWLLGSLSITFALLAINLESWIPLSFFVLAGWRYVIELKNWQYPKLWVRLPMTLIGGVTVLLIYGSLFGRDASVALFLVMVALKLLETRSKRDYIVMILLSYFLTINVLLFTQAIWVFFAILMALFGLTACLISTTHSNKLLPWKHQAKLAGTLLLQAVPVMLVLFVLFPRIPGPLWGVPKDAYSGMSGLDDSMEPGSVSELALSNKIAFRVEFKTAIPPNNQLYWRGPVLWHQEGRKWQMTSDKLPLKNETLDVSGPVTDYTITLEPHNRNWLLMLDMPTNLPPNAIRKHDMQVLSLQPVRTRIRYDGHSNTHYQLGKTLSDKERTLALQLLEDENPKTHKLAEQWLADKKTPQQIVQAALTMFHEQPFVYTLAPPRLGPQPVDDFLFNTKRGFCEHYASSFVYLMRAAGVPARIVTGYQGGELNPNGNYLIVRQSDAHAWAEVWLEDQGWVRVDPTAAVAPNRIEYGISNALPDTDLLPIFSRQDYPTLKKLYLNWDAINNGWNQWVLGYDEKKQLSLLKNLLSQKIAWEDIGLILVSTLIALMSVISYFLLRNRDVVLDPLKKTYQVFLNKLAKAGMIKAQHEGVMSFAARSAAQLPDKAQDIIEISELYSAMQYARRGDKQQKNALLLLKQLIKNFRIK